MVATRACRLGSAAGTVLRDITALNSLSTQFPALTGTGATETRPYFALQGGMVLPQRQFDRPPSAIRQDGGGQPALAMRMTSGLRVATGRRTLAGDLVCFC